MGRICHREMSRHGTEPNSITRFFCRISRLQDLSPVIHGGQYILHDFLHHESFYKKQKNKNYSLVSIQAQTADFCLLRLPRTKTDQWIDGTG